VGFNKKPLSRSRGGSRYDGDQLQRSLPHRSHPYGVSWLWHRSLAGRLPGGRQASPSRHSRCEPHCTRTDAERQELPSLRSLDEPGQAASAETAAGRLPDALLWLAGGPPRAERLKRRCVRAWVQGRSRLAASSSQVFLACRQITSRQNGSECLVPACVRQPGRRSSGSAGFPLGTGRTREHHR